MRYVSDATDRLIGKKIKIHGGKIPAKVRDAISSCTVRIDYDGYLDPVDKKTRIAGCKIITLEELKHPESVYAEELYSTNNTRIRR